MVVPDDLPLSFKVAAAGSAACFADFITFPLDTAKVRLQVQGESKANSSQVVSKASQFQYRGLIGTIATIARKEGPKSLFNGLSAGLQRQLCFASVRLGFYDSVKSIYTQLLYGKSQSNGMAILPRVCAGMTTGGLAVLLAQPTDVVKVRFQAQQSGKAGTIKYLSTLQAYRTIAKEEGAKGLWKGCATNASRNAIVNVSEIVCYDIVKEAIITQGWLKDGIPCHFSSAVVAGFCATLVASPVDVVKTRYMNAPHGNYTGALDCAAKMFKTEGCSAFYKGFTPSFCRLVSWNIVLWLSYEQIKVVITESKYFKDRHNSH